MPIPPAPGITASQAGPAMRTQPRPNVADQIERLTSRFDDLAYRARLAKTQSDHDDVDEMVLTFCRDLRGIVRSPTPTAPPLRVTSEGALF